jgi:D-glycero-D-manno-heptose 1,7-bisphosphate phosphatase
MLTPAVFLDRDGTIIEQVHHLRHPGDVRVIAGAGEALGRLQSNGYAAVVVSNQSVIGRGMLTEAGLAEVHAEMCRQLSEHGVALDGCYYCPIAPMGTDRRSIEHVDRKPGPGMLLRAAREHRLDLSRSWMVGDTISDLLAGRNAGCMATILVKTGYGAECPHSDPAIDFVVDDLAAAAEVIVAGRAEGRSAERIGTRSP